MSSASDDWKLKICEDEPGVIEIVGNREGLRFLAKVCVSLSDLSDEEAKTAANHQIFQNMHTTLNEFGSNGWDLVAVSMGDMTEPRLFFQK